MLQEERQAGEGERGATSRTEKGSPQSKGKIATAVKEVTRTKTTAETTVITRITTAEAKKKKWKQARDSSNRKASRVVRRNMYRDSNKSRATGARQRHSTQSVKGLGGRLLQ